MINKLTETRRQRKHLPRSCCQTIPENLNDLRKKIGDKAYFEWCSYNLELVSIERAEDIGKDVVLSLIRKTNE